MATDPDDLKHLKAMIAAARKEPVNIAVCMGKKPEDAVVLMHKIKKSEALAREAKAKGDTVKIAFGTIEIDGAKAKLTCADKPPGGLAKQMKAYFKSVDIMMTVELMDASGQPISDEPATGSGAEEGGASGSSTQAAPEAAPQPTADPLKEAWEKAWAAAEPKVAKALQTDSPEAAKIRAVQAFALGKAEAGQYEAASKSLVPLLALLEQVGKAAPSPSPAEPAGQPSSEPGLDRTQLAKRAAEVKTRLSAVDGPLGQKLTEGFVKAVEQIKAGALDAAADLLTKLETTLGKIEASKGPAPASGSATPEPSSADPRLAKISGAEDQLRKQVTSSTAGDVQAALLEVLDRVAQAVADGEAETALGGLKRVQDGLKLQAEVDRISPLVAQAASSGMVADVNALTLLFNSIADKIPAPDQAKALAGLARVEEMIAAGKTQGKSAHEQDQPLEIRPYAEARINWNLTREKLRSEIGRLEAGIAAVLKEEGLDGEVQVVGQLLGYIEKLDARLETKLAEIVNSDAGDEREALKKEARTLIAEYKAELNGEFFSVVDDANGFLSVSVASTARSVLNDLSNVLAA